MPVAAAQEYAAAVAAVGAELEPALEQAKVREEQEEQEHDSRCPEFFAAPGVSFDFVTAAERSALYLSASHRSD